LVDLDDPRVGWPAWVLKGDVPNEGDRPMGHAFVVDPRVNADLTRGETVVKQHFSVTADARAWSAGGASGRKHQRHEGKRHCNARQAAHTLHGNLLVGLRFHRKTCAAGAQTGRRDTSVGQAFEPDSDVELNVAAGQPANSFARRPGCAELLALSPGF